MENLQLMIEIAEALAKVRKSRIDRLDIQYNSMIGKYATYCYISGYKTCYKINENLTIEIINES